MSFYLIFFFLGGGGGGATSLKGGEQGGRDSQDFGPGEQIPMDLAPGGGRVISRGGGRGGAKSLGYHHIQLHKTPIYANPRIKHGVNLTLLDKWIKITVYPPIYQSN